MPSDNGAGGARSDFTTCLPVPRRGWAPLVRSKQAVFRVPDFERIGVWTCLATAVESARSIRTGSNLAHPSCYLRCTRRSCCAEIGHILGGLWCTKVGPPGSFSIIGHMVAYGPNAPQTSTICQSRTVIKSVLWLVSNG